MFHSPHYQYTTKAHATLLMILFQNQIEGLANAAELLAGARGRRLVQDIGDRLQADPSVDVRTSRMLGELLDILSLENVHIEGSDEAGYFAEIDVEFADVEEICLLTDALRAALGQLQSAAA